MYQIGSVKYDCTAQPGLRECGDMQHRARWAIRFQFDFNSISDISSFSVPLISGHFRYYSLFFIIFALGCSEFKTASPVIRSEMWGKNTDRE